MDAKKFGRFVAERRKELKMTQKDLAAKIQVTDKAVSKWERGLGFPDINTIEYLEIQNTVGNGIYSSFDALSESSEQIFFSKARKTR